MSDWADILGDILGTLVSMYLVIAAASSAGRAYAARDFARMGRHLGWVGVGFIYLCYWVLVVTP